LYIPLLKKVQINEVLSALGKKTRLPKKGEMRELFVFGSCRTRGEDRWSIHGNCYRTFAFRQKGEKRGRGKAFPRGDVDLFRKASWPREKEGESLGEKRKKRGAIPPRAGHDKAVAKRKNVTR